MHNLKELRPGSAGKTEIRILFIFDPKRRAILLVAGDKAGNRTRWYRDAIKLAEDRYTRYRFKTNRAMSDLGLYDWVRLTRYFLQHRVLSGASLRGGHPGAM